MATSGTSIDQDIRAAQDTLRNAGMATGDAAAQLLGTAADQLASVRKKLEALTAQAQSQGLAAAKVTDDYVHRHPWHSALTAALAGAVVGMLISR